MIVDVLRVNARMASHFFKDLGKLKSFGNFKNDLSQNWGRPGED